MDRKPAEIGFLGGDQLAEADLVSGNLRIRRSCLTQLENAEIPPSRLQSRRRQGGPAPALRYGFAESQSFISVFSPYVRFDSLLKLRETLQLLWKANAALAHAHEAAVTDYEV
jgi:hypothetical protein